MLFARPSGLYCILNARRIIGKRTFDPEIALGQVLDGIEDRI
jgi:hypothetical protein